MTWATVGRKNAQCIMTLKCSIGAIRYYEVFKLRWDLIIKDKVLYLRRRILKSILDLTWSQRKEAKRNMLFLDCFSIVKSLKQALIHSKQSS